MNILEVNSFQRIVQPQVSTDLSLRNPVPQEAERPWSQWFWKLLQVITVLLPICVTW